MIPDGELVLVNYLKGHDAVEALDTRIVGKTPKDTAGSWVRITELDAPSPDLADHFVEFYFQIDCYASEGGLEGSQQREAKLIARTIRAALAELNVGPTLITEGAVITGAQANSGARQPDSDLGPPARERMRSTAKVWMHAEDEA